MRQFDCPVPYPDGSAARRRPVAGVERAELRREQCRAGSPAHRRLAEEAAVAREAGPPVRRWDAPLPAQERQAVGPRVRAPASPRDAHAVPAAAQAQVTLAGVPRAASAEAEELAGLARAAAVPAERSEEPAALVPQAAAEVAVARDAQPAAAEAEPWDVAAEAAPGVVLRREAAEAARGVVLRREAAEAARGAVLPQEAAEAALGLPLPAAASALPSAAASACRRGRALPFALAQRRSVRPRRAMRSLQIASPSWRSWQAAGDEV